jgi:hypothetical protein
LHQWKNITLFNSLPEEQFEVLSSLTRFIN